MAITGLEAAVEPLMREELLLGPVGSVAPAVAATKVVIPVLLERME
jgi:hypothetical protein